MCAAAQAPARNFANLLSKSKGIKKFKKKTPPVEAIMQIAGSGKDNLPSEFKNRIEFTVIYDEKLKTRLEQASESMFHRLYTESKNDIDRAKLNAYNHYAKFFIKAPVVFAITQTNRFNAEINDIVHAMQICAQVHGLEIHELMPQLSAHKEFAQVLGLKKPAQVLTLLAIGYPD